MSSDLREIRKRISSARQIRRVTAALQQVAAAKLSEGLEPLGVSRIYLDKIRNLMAELYGVVDERDLMKGRGNGVGLVVFGGSRGLCGSFNAELVKEMKEFYAEHGGKDIRLIIMGKVIGRYASRLGMKVDDILTQPQLFARAVEISRIAGVVVDSFLNGRLKEVYMLYSEYVSRAHRVPRLERILPPVFEQRARVKLSSTVFEPDPKEILAMLITDFARQSMDCAFMNSFECENAARQASMTRASENAREMVDDLMLVYSRLRQEEITTEVVELSAAGVDC